MPASTLPRRDAKGWFLELPTWLKPGWKRVNEAGLGTGGVQRKLCVRANCPAIALKFSLYCRITMSAGDVSVSRSCAQHRPSNYTGRAVQTYRANAKNLWRRAPWFPDLTIWLGPNSKRTLSRTVAARGCPYPGPRRSVGHTALGLAAQRAELQRWCRLAARVASARSAKRRSVRRQKTTSTYHLPTCRLTTRASRSCSGA